MSNLEIPEAVKMWKLGGKAGNIRSQNNYPDNSGYNLFCQSNNKYLTWKKVPLGINLDFIGDAAVKKTHFRLPMVRNATSNQASWSLSGSEEAKHFYGTPPAP